MNIIIKDNKHHKYYKNIKSAFDSDFKKYFLTFLILKI